MDIGKRIREIREKRGMEQLELAQKINISQSKMNKIETGFQKRIEPEILRDLAKVLNVTVDYLVNGEMDHGTEYNPLEDLKQFMIENNLQDMNLSFFNIEDWKKLNKDDIEEIKRHFEWVVEKAKQREEEDD